MSSQEKFFCIPCNKELFLRNQRRHYDSQGHRTKFLTYSKKNGIVVSQENFENNQESKQVELCECAICMDEYPKPNHKSCSGCKQVWCNNCDKKLHTCPYCRQKIQGRQELLNREREERIREEQEVIRRHFQEQHQQRIRIIDNEIFRINELIDGVSRMSGMFGMSGMFRHSQNDNMMNYIRGFEELQRRLSGFNN